MITATLNHEIWFSDRMSGETTTLVGKITDVPARYPAVEAA
jgi:hypothetical protein